MFNLGFGEILIICAVLIVVVGPERLPALMKNVGKTLRTVRQASRELQQTVGLDELMREDITRPAPPPQPRLPPAATVSRDAPPPASNNAVAPIPGPAAAAALAAVEPAVEPGAEPLVAGAPVVAAVTESSAPANAPPPAAPAEPHTSNGAEPKRSAEQTAAPSLAEADELSISERMLSLHTPKDPSPPASSPPERPVQGTAPQSGAAAGDRPSEGSKGEG